ncbi:hypothetical protein RH915_00400 [Serpentinicella sp. ANB-PHB4]|uniref:hypothetical protein n=1 Tax=Serpentinicella sp. ANB-PHB4 TaxID=3074076 RepID=UPI002858FBE9|nr:hypothetical protein [Serpentinicella sp. ANB-PHB4]MDR5657940.1 hypothetical protein [Serpentinicella sp. ANB-PHB4]
MEHKKSNLNPLNHNKLNVGLLIFFLAVILGKDNRKLSLKGLQISEVEKKTKLLNRIKGYMSPDEQRIIHKAEIVLQLLEKAKMLFDVDELISTEVQYSALSTDERKRNMLMDLCEFVHEEKRDVVHKAIELDIMAKDLGDKIKDIQSINTNNSGLTIDHIEKYFDLFEPFLDQQIKEKVVEGKKLLSMMKLYKSIEQKGKINEADIMTMIEPYIPDDQKDSLYRMINIVKVLSEMNTNENDRTVEKKQSVQKPESKDDLTVVKSDSKKET